MDRHMGTKMNVISFDESNTTFASPTKSTNYIEYSYGESIIQATALALIMFAALSLNAMNLLIVLRNSVMQNPRYMFIMNLVCGDLGVALLSMPFSLITTIYRKWVFGSDLCKLHGFLGSFFFCASLFTMAVMSIEQYYLLVKPLSRAITVRRAWYIMAGVWTLAAVVSIGPLAGWGHFGYNSSTLACGISFPRSAFERIYLFLLVQIAFVVPLLIMGYVYLRILVAVRKHSQRLAKFSSGSSEVIALQRRITCTLLLVLIIFLVCWTPFVCLVVFASLNSDVHHLPYGLGVAAYWCGYFNSACNPVIFVIRNDRFRDGYREILTATWYSLRCHNRPPRLRPNSFKGVWYLNRTCHQNGNSRIMIESFKPLHQQSS